MNLRWKDAEEAGTLRVKEVQKRPKYLQPHLLVDAATDTKYDYTHSFALRVTRHTCTVA